MTRLLLPVLSAALVLSSGRVCAEDVAAKDTQEMVKKGLAWLVKSQHADGHWDGDRVRTPVALTALAGMTLLMEGSTCAEGPYAPAIRKAIDWLVERRQANGLIGNTKDPTEGQQ